jgi:hypothetical protein
MTRMAFLHEGHRVFWRGLGSTRIDVPSTNCLNTIRNNEPTMLNCLLQSFEDVITEPQGLPPPRPCDHRIHLLPNTASMAVRPYWYPQLQKHARARHHQAKHLGVLRSCAPRQEGR